MEAFPSIQLHGPSVTSMHDNARPHLAAITREVLATNNENVLDWPSNPTEQVWDELGHCVRRNHAIHTVNYLAATLQAEWANSPGQFMQRYVNSMCGRIKACIAQNDGHTRY